MNLKGPLIGATAVSLAFVSVPAFAAIHIGDTLDLQFQYGDFDEESPRVYADSGNFTFTGDGQSQPTLGGSVTTILNTSQVVFSNSWGCGGCFYPAGNWNGPVLFDISNGTAFSGWTVLSDTVGISSSYLTGGAIGVNWQSVPTQGETVVGSAAAPEASTWAMMGLGFAGLAFAGYRSRRSVTAAA